MTPGENQNSLSICLGRTGCHSHPVQNCLQIPLPLDLHYHYGPVAVLDMYGVCYKKQEELISIAFNIFKGAGVEPWKQTCL